MNESLDNTIRNHPFFKGMKANHLAMLAKGAKEMSYKPGETMFKEGEPASRFFLIQSGEVALEAHEPGDGRAVVETLREGDVIGWSWLFPPFTWHLLARAVEPTSVIVLDGAHLLGAAEQHHDFGYELMKRVAQLAVHRMQATRKQLLDLENEIALQG
jgi:CRP-like cAMP-binding protein